VDEAFAAAKMGYADVVFYYLNTGHVPSDAVDGLGRTLLFVAVLHHRSSVVTFLLDNTGMFDVNRATNSGNTALHAAVQNEDLKIVVQLLNAGADPDQKNPISGGTPRTEAEMSDFQPALALFSSAGV
jgi:ankyrin repeat protein